MTVGELRWVAMPARGGHAQTGRRPAIIVQQASALPTVLLIPLTSQQDALRFAATVLVEPDEHNGLRQPSVALVFQLTAVDQKFVGARLGRVSGAALKEIWLAFDELTGRT
ncbi:MAG TPA: type II toxin-antitoxin system PemK/MazF family toxin [Pyrinomonadaceae bacterium]